MAAYDATVVAKKQQEASPVKSGQPVYPGGVGEGVGFDPRTGLPSTAGNNLVQAGQKMAGLGARAAGPAMGQALGAYTGIAAPIMVPALGAAGGVIGEYAGSKAEGTNSSLGDYLAAAGYGAIPGASMARATGKQMAKEAGKFAAAGAAAETARLIGDDQPIWQKDAKQVAKQIALGAAGGAASPYIGKILESGANADLMAIERANNFIAERTIAKANQEVGEGLGYKVIPSQALPNEMEKVTNNLVRRDIGLHKEAPISEVAINSRINELNQPFKEASELGGAAASAYKDMQTARSEAKKQWNAYLLGANAGNPNPALQESYHTFKELATIYEQQLANEATKVGRPDLAKSIFENRILLAKAHLADEAANYSRGVIDPKVYGARLAKGKEITGDAKKIADTYNANLTKEQATGSLLSRTLTLAKIALGEAEKTSLGQYILMNRPSYTASPDAMGAMARFAAMQNAPKFDPSMLMNYSKENKQ